MTYETETYTCAFGHIWLKPKIVKLTTARGTILMSEPYFRRTGRELFSDTITTVMEDSNG